MAAAEFDPQNAVVLVTGGSGLVGMGLQRLNQESPLPGKWIFVGSKDADLRNLSEVRALFERTKPTHVFHLAALVGGLFINMKYKVEFLVQNLAMNHNVLQCSKEFGVQKCFCMASTCIFPDKTTYPLNEQMLHNGPPHSSNEGYAYAKRMCDVACRMYNEQYGTNFVTIIPTNIFGPHDNYNMADGHVLPGLIHRCYLAKQNNEPLTVWGSGKPLRQFVYSLDLARLLVWCAFEYKETGPIILSCSEDEEVSIADVAHMVAKAMDFQGEIIFDTSKADGQFKKTASNAKLLSLHPTFRFTPMQEAIDVSVKWFVDNFATARTASKDTAQLFSSKS